MKKFLGLLVLLFLATAALADPVPVHVGPLSFPNGSTGPYYGDVTDPDGTTFQPLICFSDQNPPSAPWDGLKYSINTVEGAWGSLTQYDFNVLGYLADQLFAVATTPYNQLQYELQHAIWIYADGILGLQYANGAVQPTQAELDLIAAAEAAVQGGYITGDYFLIPDNSVPGDGPQPLIERAPEPTSMLLLGSGMLSIAGAVRRKLLK